jgi:hypothetical protein
MNLFRSEEHARRWSGYRAEAAAGLLPLAQLHAIFSADFFRQRLSGRYLSDFKTLRADLVATVARVTGNDPFWWRA